AILKFQFLNISPIALQRIVDLISDSFVIINKEYDVIDYNKTFINIFHDFIPIKRKENFLDALDAAQLNDKHRERLVKYNLQAIESRTTEKYEDNFNNKVIDLYFSIEITPIYSGDLYLGTIILLKDITQAKKDLETIQKNHAVLMEQERLASLGQLIGGIAHNLKTPIMTISGGLDTLRALAEEYEESIDDKTVTSSDHHEIARDLKEWVEKIKPYCAYMSDIISAVKDQAVNLIDSTTGSFTLGDLLKRVELLMKHELKKFHCRFNINTEVGMLTEFKGEVNNLVQIFDNIIVNAIQAYGEKQGVIDLKIEVKENHLLFSFQDYGMGMSPEIQKKLFKEMLTTKGKDGTGLGLYMSFATIKGKFDGDMWVSSTLGKGTTIFVSIPYYKVEKKV
ncbi:MAG: HAMP domain-containing histidine kinase, partial [Clostridia bacterium]|nr:HAMP domain-containing histidine kinase [Clostridia bacterium]